MSKSFSSVIDGLDLDQIDIDDQGFYEDRYEVECYYDVYKWHPSGTYRTDDITYAGSTVNPVPYLDENENLDVDKFDSAIRRQIIKAIEDEDRVGPVYVIC